MRLKRDQCWIDLLRTWPESGMGYQRVDVTMADGREIQDATVLNVERLEAPIVRFRRSRARPYETARVVAS